MGGCSSPDPGIRTNVFRDHLFLLFSKSRAAALRNRLRKVPAMKTTILTSQPGYVPDPNVEICYKRVLLAVAKILRCSAHTCRRSTRFFKRKASMAA